MTSGDIAAWISVGIDAVGLLLVIGVPTVGFMKRGKIAQWLKATFYEAPPPPMTPHWEAGSGIGRNEFTLTNSTRLGEDSPEAAAPRSVRLRFEDGHVHTAGASWNEVGWGEEVSFLANMTADFPSGECTVVWQQRDASAPGGWREERDTVTFPFASY